MTDRLAEVADKVVALHGSKQKDSRPRRLSFKFAGETKPHLREQYLVKGLLPVGLALLYGRANGGKTALTIDLVAHLAGGIEYRERRTRHGLVVYVALEARESVENRLAAWCLHHGIDIAELQLAVVGGLLDLRHRPSVNELLEIVAEIEARACEPVQLIVLDTLARAMPGANENDSAEMGATIAAIERIRAELGNVSVMAVHHLGKDDTRGPRGHSSLLAAVDSAFEVKDGELIVHKARDAKIGEALAFTLRGVTIGADEDGDPVTAVVAVAADAPTANKARVPMRLADGSKLALRVLRELLRTEGVAVAGLDAPAGTVAVQIARWREGHQERFGGLTADSDAKGAERQAWKRALQQLQAASIVSVRGAWVWAHDKRA